MVIEYIKEIVAEFKILKFDFFVHLNLIKLLYFLTMTLPTWNLNQFYGSIEDNQINKDFKNLINKSKSFQKKYRAS